MRDELEATAARARSAGVEARWIALVLAGLAEVELLPSELAAKGLAGDAAGMLLHSSDFLELFSILIVAWQHLDFGAAALSTTHDDAAFVRGKVLAMDYWLATELPRLESLSKLCRSGEDSYARVRPEEL